MLVASITNTDMRDLVFRYAKQMGPWWPCLLFSCLFWAGSWHGMEATHDSWAYLHAARTWMQLGSMQYTDGTPYVLWPPLYPLLLAYWPFGSLQTFRLLHWAAACATLALNVSLFCQGWPSRWRLAYGLLLAVALPLLTCAHFFWSETVFMFLLSAWLYALRRYLRQGKGVWLLLWWGALLPLQRTAGFFPMCGLALGLLAVYGWGSRRQRLFLFALLPLSLLPGLLWHLYAVWWIPSREGFSAGGWPVFWGYIGQYAYVLLRWCAPLPFGAWPLGLASLLLGAWGYRQGGGPRLVVLAMGFYLLCYLVLPSLKVFGGELDESERFLAPLYAPFMALLLLALRRLPHRYAWVLCLWLLCYGGLRTAKATHLFIERTPTVRIPR